MRRLSPLPLLRNLGSLCAGCLLLALLPASISHAGPTAGAIAGLSDSRVVGDRELARLRGGFSRGGLEINFGIEHAVLINGVLRSHSILFASGRRQVDAGNLRLIQNGPGNTVSPALLQSASPAVTLIQNSLDYQVIQNLSLYNIEVRNLRAHRAQIAASRGIAESILLSYQ